MFHKDIFQPQESGEDKSIYLYNLYLFSYYLSTKTVKKVMSDVILFLKY